MLNKYFPVLLFIVVGLGLGLLLLSLGAVLAPNRPDAEKNSPYECGFEAFEDARMKFDVRYYLIAILFILFDLEIAFSSSWPSPTPSSGRPSASRSPSTRRSRSSSPRWRPRSRPRTR